MADNNTWELPAAMAIPKEGYFKLEQGRYGPIFPRTPACYGFQPLREIIPGSEQSSATTAKRSKTPSPAPTLSRPQASLSPLGSLRRQRRGLHFMYQGIFDTDFDKYTEDAVALFTKYGINTVFENLEGFPEDWKTNAPAFVKFVREHQCPSFLEYGEYPYVSADEIKKALKVKAAFSRHARPDAIAALKLYSARKWTRA